MSVMKREKERGRKKGWSKKKSIACRKGCASEERGRDRESCTNMKGDRISMDLLRCFPSFENSFSIFFCVLKYFQINTSHINDVPVPAVLFVVLALVLLFTLCLFFMALGHFKQVLFMWQSWASWASVQRVHIGNHNIFLDELSCVTTRKKQLVFPWHLIVEYLLFCNHSVITITKLLLRNPETSCVCFTQGLLFVFCLMSFVSSLFSVSGSIMCFFCGLWNLKAVAF